jgi:hypothetical protein
MGKAFRCKKHGIREQTCILKVLKQPNAQGLRAFRTATVWPEAGHCH